MHPFQHAVITLAVFALGATIAPTNARSAEAANASSRASGAHDFDFLMGQWRVKHEKLTQRLANNPDSVTFEGTMVAQPLLGGSANVDDNVLHAPSGTYRGASIRAYDDKTGQWSIWWLDSRMPSAPMDPPVVGGFKDGVGTFTAEQVINGKNVTVRYLWKDITKNSAHWEQAFSDDHGKTWETNWRMDFERVR